MRLVEQTWGTAFPMVEGKLSSVDRAARARADHRSLGEALAGDAMMPRMPLKPLTLRRDVDCGPTPTRLGDMGHTHSDAPAAHDVPLRWQPKNNWRPGCPTSDDPVLHVQSALEQVERKMKNLQALLGTTQQPEDDGHRVA